MSTISHPRWLAPFRQSRSLDSFRLQNAGVVYALILMVVVLTVVSLIEGRPPYLSPINTANVLDQTGIVGILAVFMTIVLISGNFDLSIGAIAVVVAGFSLMAEDRYGVLVSVVGGLLIGLAFGLVNGLLVQLVGINAFIVTLGTQTAIRAVLLIFTNGSSVQARGEGLYDLIGGNGSPLNLRIAAVVIGLVLLVAGAASMRQQRRRSQPIDLRTLALLVGGATLSIISWLVFPDEWPLSKQVYVMFALTILCWAVLRFTIVGRRLYAVGGNGEAARLSGINVAAYKIVPFALNGCAAAIAGILYAGRFGATNPNALTGIELTVLAAAILGGTSLFGGAGSVVKSLVGALILFVLGNGFNILNLGSNYQGLIQGIVIIGAAGIYVIASRRGLGSGTQREGKDTVGAAQSDSTPSEPQSVRPA
ncbi:MAG: ABC transporter permease [Candidatus Dormibacteraeota bacterium]|uniref:ABC transporter permease n=2 Tax=Candidatus Dormiibacter inghamiae TaxID=3127013 RepID=A0A934KKP0_9BACT|nr:ABC transporter permease [Candidatus Dormibacteraeota bacterium]MBJ7606145.1 ABC transporter permease [Candidatus Dormibacteraeota bacterium]